MSAPFSSPLPKLYPGAAPESDEDDATNFMGRFAADRSVHDEPTMIGRIPVEALDAERMFAQRTQPPPPDAPASARPAPSLRQLLDDAASSEPQIKIGSEPPASDESPTMAEAPAQLDSDVAALAEMDSVPAFESVPPLANEDATTFDGPMARRSRTSLRPSDFVRLKLLRPSPALITGAAIVAFVVGVALLMWLTRDAR